VHVLLQNPSSLFAAGLERHLPYLSNRDRMNVQRKQLVTQFWSVVIMLAAAATPGCGLKTAQPDAPAAIAPRGDLRPAPQWLANRLAQAAPDVFFGLGEYAIGLPQREELLRIVPGLKQILRDSPDLIVVLEGHCDDRGSAEFNLRLGQRRAEAVQRVLVSQGIPANHLRIVSFGEGVPPVVEG